LVQNNQEKSVHLIRKSTPSLAYWINDNDIIDEITENYSLEQKLALVVEGYQAVRKNIALLSYFFDMCVETSKLNNHIIQSAVHLCHSLSHTYETENKLIEAYEANHDSNIKKLMVAFKKLFKLIENEYALLLDKHENNYQESGYYNLAHTIKVIENSHMYIVPGDVVSDAFAYIYWLTDQDERRELPDFGDFCESALY